MSNLNKALAIAVHFPVFPVREKDEVVDGRLKKMKTPYNYNGATGATKDVTQIQQWWAKHPNALVGYKGLILDVDKGHDSGKDGFTALIDAGIDFPDTFVYTTFSGGEHYVFRPIDTYLGPCSDLITPDGLVLEGVDRRSDNGYAIWWGDDVPATFDAFKDAPDWFLKPLERSAVEYDGTLEEWVSSLTDDAPSARMELVLKYLPAYPNFGHDALIKAQWAIVKEHAKGEKGAKRALEYVYGEFCKGKYDDANHQKEYWDGLRSAVEKAGGTIAPTGAIEGEPELSTEEIREVEIAQGVEKELVRIEVKRRIASMFFAGSTDVSWDEMEDEQIEWLVDGILSKDSLAFLVAKGNMGKTYLYIALVLSMLTGRTFLGRDTNPANVLIVLGEGHRGFLKRIKSWLKHYGGDPEVVRNHVHFIKGGNLNNETSVELIRQKASAVNAELIIFDTYSATSGVQDENDNALQSITINVAKSIKEGACVLFVHHANKSTEDTERPQMRGATALYNAADTVISMFEDKDAGYSVKKKYLKVSTDTEHGGKTRADAPETFAGLYIDEVDDDCVVLCQTSSESISRTDRQLRKYLGGTFIRAVSVEEIISASGKSRSTVFKWLKNTQIAEKTEDGKYRLKKEYRDTSYGH